VILNIFTIVVMILLVGVVIVIVAMLGMWPGKTARKRGHPQADAINVASWVGVITLGLLWPLALIWAYTRPAGWVPGATTPGDTPPQGTAGAADEVARLVARLDAVEKQLGGLQDKQEASR
jgi:hypothetical protein